MNMRVDAPGGYNLAFATNNIRPGTDKDIHGVLYIGVAGFADSRNATMLDANVSFDDAPVINDQRIGDHQIHHLIGFRLRLSHAITYHLAAAELDFIAINSEIFFHLNPQLGIRQSQFITRSGAEHFCIGLPAHSRHYNFSGMSESSAPIIFP